MAPNPATFRFEHVLLLLLIGVGSVGLHFLYQRTEKKMVKYAASVISFAMAGIIASYFATHLVVIIMKLTGAIRGSAGFAFYGILVALGMICFIIGGLLGLIRVRKNEEQQQEE